MKITIKHKDTEFHYEDNTQRSIGDKMETPRIIEAVKCIIQDIAKLQSKERSNDGDR